MSLMRKIFYTLVTVVGLGAVSTACLGFWAWDYFYAPGPLKAPVTVIFARGTGASGIAAQLAGAQAIDQPLLFRGIAMGLGIGRSFKAGEYQVEAGQSPQAIMQMLAEGKVVVHKITVAEGLSVRDVVKLMTAEPLLSGEMPKTIAEGSLLPQTYHFERGEKREDVVKRMQDGMKKTLADLWAKHKQGIMVTTPEEALTLASIVEKETGVKEERGHVASVFMNRLRIGMKLQSDPTVAYGVEQALGGPLGRPLTTEDLRTPTPYNTYMIAALPPGPIANPGEASLMAVMNPPDTDDLYFVATGKGGHFFATSLEEHNRNVAAYRRGR